MYLLHYFTQCFLRVVEWSKCTVKKHRLIRLIKGNHTFIAFTVVINQLCIYLARVKKYSLQQCKAVEFILILHFVQVLHFCTV